MGVGKAFAAKIRHRVGFAPDNVIENPETQVLKHRANAKNIVIRANDPKRTIVLENPPGFCHPLAGKLVIGRKSVKLVPGIINSVNPRLVRPGQFARQLQIIGRICKNNIYGSGWNFLEFGNAVTAQNFVQ